MPFDTDRDPEPRRETISVRPAMGKEIDRARLHRPSLWNATRGMSRIEWVEEAIREKLEGLKPPPPAPAPSPIGPTHWRTCGITTIRSVLRYMLGEPLDALDISRIRSYLAVWMNGRPGEPMAAYHTLAAVLETIETREDIAAWVQFAREQGEEPL